MDQSTLAGLGNVYSDEVLFRAGIHPRRKLEDLEDRDLDRLFAAMREVLEAAIEAQVETDKMPDDFLIPLREVEKPRCPRCGASLATVKACGRTAYFCPSCQPIPD